MEPIPVLSLYSEAQPDSRRYVIILLWAACSLLLAWLALSGPNTFGSTGTLVALGVMLACTLAIHRWIPNPIPVEPVHSVSRGLLLLAGLAALVLLLLLVALLGRMLMFVLPVIALAALLWLRPSFDRPQVLYAAGLALAAALAGLGAGWIKFVPPAVWSVLQFPLTLFGLLAGWAVLRRSGLSEVGVGKSRLLAGGWLSALRGLGQGILLAMPWALAAIVMGGSSTARQDWVQQWWQPLAALDAGIAEEAWGRLLLVPLLFLFLRRFSSGRTGFTVAIVVVGYWFAFLHTVDAGNLPSMLVSTLIIGTLTVLPLSRICLYRDLETAIGFHFFVDFLQFAGALFV